MTSPDSQESTTPRFPRQWSFPAFVVLALFLITESFFLAGRAWAPAGTSFDGFTGMVADQNMYYSFIRQAQEGNLLFINRLTHIPHQPAMLNLEWLAVGWLTALLGSDIVVYALWRLLGITLLLGAFWWILGLMPQRGPPGGLKSSHSSVGREPSKIHPASESHAGSESAVILAGHFEFRRRVLLLLCALGGGFGWLFELLHRVGLARHVPLNMLDTSDALCSPFSQMLFNPHLSLTHGLSVLMLGAWIRGEQTGKSAWYVTTGTIALLNGLMRPYDLIVLWGAVPLFILADRYLLRSPRPANPRHFLLTWRWLPLGLTAPVLIYYAVLFQYHPVFKYWASQGVVTPLAITWHLINLGLAGLLFVWRLINIQRQPFSSPTERVLMVWIVAALLLFHAHRLPFFGFMPYTPLLGSTLLTTMLLLGSGAREPWRFLENRLPTIRILLAVMLILVSSLSSAVWAAKIGRNLARLPEHFHTDDEQAMKEWLRENAHEVDVVLTTLPLGNRLAKDVSARFVVAHINVTPHSAQLAAQVDKLYGGEMNAVEIDDRLRDWNVRWIVVPSATYALRLADWQGVAGVSLSYENKEWIVLKRRE